VLLAAAALHGGGRLSASDDAGHETAGDGGTEIPELALVAGSPVEFGSMDKRSALRLKRGDLVHYGSSRRMCDHRWRRRGIVEKVTPAGGILVEIVPRDADDRPWWVRPWNDWERVEEWTAYDHVFSVEPWTVGA